MTLNANALVSVADCQLWLRRNNATGVMAADDASLLAELINGVSTAIARYTGREFVDPTGNDGELTRIFEYDGSGHLDITPYDLRSITSATLGADALLPTTGIGDGDYVPMPRNQTMEGTYLYLTMRSYYTLIPSYGLYSPVLRTRDVTITGTWGMVAVPPDVQTACKIAVADQFRNPDQGESRGSGEFAVTELGPSMNPGSDESLPYGATRLLEAFKRYG